MLHLCCPLSAFYLLELSCFFLTVHKTADGCYGEKKALNCKFSFVKGHVTSCTRGHTLPALNTRAQGGRLTSTMITTLVSLHCHKVTTESRFAREVVV